MKKIDIVKKEGIRIEKFGIIVMIERTRRIEIETIKIEIIRIEITRIEIIKIRININPEIAETIDLEMTEMIEEDEMIGKEVDLEEDLMRDMMKIV